MLKKRIIPTLLYNNNTLVKGKNFKSDRSVGSAIESIKIYNHFLTNALISVQSYFRSVRFVIFEFLPRNFWTGVDWTGLDWTGLESTLISTTSNLMI